MFRKFAFFLFTFLAVGFASADEQQTPPSTEPIDVVKQQWRQNALLWLQKADNLERKLKGISGEKVPSDLVGEMLLLSAYTNFIRPDTESIVMKQAEKLLICHLIFNAKNGLVDIAYIYDENGKLKTVRIDSIPKGVFVSIASYDKSGRVLIISFSESDATIAIDRLDPFAAVVTKS